MKEKIIIIGAGPNARLAYEFIQSHRLYDVVGFAVNEEYKKNDEFYGMPLYSIENLKNIFNLNEVKVFVALLWNRLNSDRKKLYNDLKNEGFIFANLISPFSTVRTEKIGENVWIHDFCVVQDSVEIGDNVAIMAQSLIGNNAIIKNHCFLGAKSTIGGGSVIGEQTFVGINCTVFDDTIVGKKCILGACTAVKRNVPDFTLYKTSSDDIVMKQYDEDVIESKLQFRKNKR